MFICADIISQSAVELWYLISQSEVIILCNLKWPSIRCRVKEKVETEETGSVQKLLTCVEST